MIAVAGLALGLAVGTKLTFIVPTFVIVAGMTLAAGRRRRARVAALIAAPLALTGGWWYVRNVIAVGNPIGLHTHIALLTLPGPVSALANASQQTVFSELRHLSLWGSRFIPGLEHALGILWPLVVVLYAAAVVAGIFLVADPTVRTIAVAAALAGISYLFLPTGATGIEQGTTLFQVNLRYATPALGLGLVLVPLVVRLRAPRLLRHLGGALTFVLVVTQLVERVRWPTQKGRHLVFLIGVGALGAVLWRGRGLRHRPRPVLAAGAAVIALLGGAGIYAVERHYFDRRYLVAYKDAGRGAIYRWAQSVAHARIALYGTVEQYPLYGAADTNRVEYLGAKTADGGFRPIPSCAAWRTALNDGRYRYVVLSPAPTSAIPTTWTRDDASAKLVLHPAPDDFVFRVTGSFHPALCPSAGR